MSKPNATAMNDVDENIDWNSFLDMDMVDAELRHAQCPTASSSETKPMASGVPSAEKATDRLQTGNPNYPVGSSSAWTVDHTPQSIDAGDVGGQNWSRAPVADSQRTSLYIPYFPPLSRQTPSIDANVPHHLQAMNNIDSVLQDPSSLIDPLAVGQSDSSAVIPQMDWLPSGRFECLQSPLGSFVQQMPTQITFPRPSVESPCLIDPALMGYALSEQGDGSSEWESQQNPVYYDAIQHFVNPDLDLRLHNALLNDGYNESAESHCDPYRHSHQGTLWPPPLSPAPTAAQLSRSIATAEPFSQSSSAGNSPNPTSMRTKPKSRARSRSFTPLPDTQGPCLTCGKNYRTSTSPGRCARCGVKWERHTAGPPTYALDRAVPDLNSAREMLYPISRGRQRLEDNVDSFLSIPGIQDHWVQKWLEAVITPVPDSGEEESVAKASWATNQQTTFNQKAKMDREGEYSAAFVTARLRALWWEVVVFHGGGISLYPIGGDSAGYAADLELRLGERLEAIGDVLKVDKRTVMDVVEGRGVGAFVGNPWGFHKRKDSNNGCNTKKKDVLKRHRGGAGTSERRKGGRKKASRASSTGATDYDDGDADEGDVDPDGRPVEMREDRV